MVRRRHPWHHKVDLTMFFDLSTTERKRDATIRELPPYRDNGWRPPTYFPELRGAMCIGVDTETKETDFDHGPGWARGEGHIVGVSIAALLPSGERGKWYFPVRHEVERQDNLDPTTVFNWLREQLDTPDIPKVVANGLYDYGWLSTENIYPKGRIYDVQFAEALIDEDGLTALDALGHKYCGQGKVTDECKEWIFKAYPGANKTNWRGYLWRTPPRLVGPSAEGDADLPLHVIQHQWKILVEENTLDLFHMECRAIPMLVRMRMQGVPVDLGYFSELREKIGKQTVELYSALSHKVGGNIDSVSAPTQLAKAFDAAGIPYLKTNTGKPSFRKEWLKELSETYGDDALDSIPGLVLGIREREKLCGTFIDSYILGRATVDRGSNGNGRIYCSFHPLRGDDGGAKTGRYSSSDPNLQNIPARTKLGKSVRYGFPPEYGHAGYHKKDYSQIEYRMLAHFAVGHGADEMRMRYVNNPSTDYHKDTQHDVALMRGINLAAMTDEERDLDRKPIKNINFGLVYGQTEKSLAYKAGWSQHQAQGFFINYHAARPFVKTTMENITGEVQERGYVSTIAGRRTRFNRWEPMRYADRVLNADGLRMSFDRDEATRRFGSLIVRAYAYRGVNYKLQGSAADVLKLSLDRCYSEGVFDYIGYPKLLVHDEGDWSKIDNTPAMNDAFKYAEHVMETTVKCRVPIKVDSTEGKTWGACK